MTRSAPPTALMLPRPALLHCFLHTRAFLLAGEVKTLGDMLDDPKRPFVAILGGSKVSDKVGVIDALIDKADTIIIGGGMCFTFLLAQGYEVGTSLKEEDWVERAGEMLKKAEERGVKMLLPTDVVVADKYAEDANTATCAADADARPT